MARSVIILTGANGKLGGNLVKQFSREYDVIYLSLRPSNFLQNLNEIKLSLADRMNDALLVHAAWPVSRIDYRNHEDNKVILGK